MRHFLWLGFLFACQPEASSVEVQPDIVFVIADDIGSADMPWQKGLAQMPHLTRLKNGGAELTQFRAFPLCTPTRVALLTGESPAKFNLLYHPLRPWDTRGLPGNAVTVAERLKAVNYQTALIGKWHLGHDQPEMHPNQQGFDYFFGFLTGAVDYWSHQSRDGGLDWQRNRASVEEPGYATRQFAQEAVAWIERAKSTPLFLCLPFSAPHIPLQAPPETIADLDHIQDPAQRLYAAMLEELDQAIGEVLQAMKKRGRPTVFVFCGDNGPARNSGAQPTGLRGAKGSTFEGGLRVPAILHWEGVIPGGVQFHQPTDVLDLPATLLSAAGAEIPAGAEGRELFGVLQGNSQLQPRTFFYAACSPGWITHAAIQNQWKLVVRQKRGEDEARILLFDLSNDPIEKNNLAKENILKSETLKRELQKWLKKNPAGFHLENLPPLQLEKPTAWQAPADWTQVK